MMFDTNASFERTTDPVSGLPVMSAAEVSHILTMWQNSGHKRELDHKRQKLMADLEVKCSAYSRVTRTAAGVLTW
jgi:hypothetical protein